MVSFAGIEIKGKTIEIGVKKRRGKLESDVCTSLGGWISNYEKERKTKIIAAGISKHEQAQTIASRIWLKQDISPFIGEFKSVAEAAKYAEEQMDDSNAYVAKTEKDGQVNTPFLVGLADYEAITPPPALKKILELAKKLKGKRVVYFSATPQGGGVALMRHALMRFYNLIGFEGSWHVMQDNPKVFNITKRKFHNVFQDVARAGETLEKSEIKLFERWDRENYRRFRRAIARADLVVIDDPQPSGIIKHIKKDFPKKKIIYRSHIQLIAKLTEEAGSAQSVSWQYLYESVRMADLFVSHPVRAFVPKEVDPDKVVMMGATTDPLDGLNKELTEAQKQYYMKVFNRLLAESKQTPLDEARPYIIQVARFDPSKGIVDLIGAYLRLCREMRKAGKAQPQLVIAGNASIDDPDGIPVYRMAKRVLGISEYAGVCKDVKILRVPHQDQLLNTLMRNCMVYLQLSKREGFEDKVSGALMKGKPVVIYRAGGMPLQVREGESGFIAEVGEIEAAADYLYRLLTDKKLYEKMSVAAREKVNYDANTMYNALYWMYLFDEILNKKRKKFGFGEVREMMKK